MKIKSILFVFVLLIAVLNLTMGMAMLPSYVTITIEFVCIYCLVYLLARTMNEEKKHVENLFRELHTRNADSLSELKSSLSDLKAEMLTRLADNDHAMAQRLQDLQKNINEELEKSNHKVAEKLQQIEMLAKDEFAKQSEGLTQNANLIQKQADERLAALLKELETAKDLSKAQSDQIKQKIDDETAPLHSSATELREFANTTTLQLQKHTDHLTLLNESMQRGVTFTTAVFQEKTDELAAAIKTGDDTLKALFAEGSGKVVDTVVGSADTLSKEITATRQALETASDECMGNIRQSRREINETIRKNTDLLTQQGAAMKEQVCSASSAMKERTKELSAAIKNSNEELKALFAKGSDKVVDTVVGNAGTLSKEITATRQALESASDKCMGTIRQSRQEINETIRKNADSLTRQGAAMNEQLRTASLELASCTNSICGELKHAVNEGNQKVTEIIRNNFNKTADNLILIEQQNKQLSRMISDHMEESDTVTEDFLTTIQAQCELTNQGLAELHTENKRIEDAVVQIMNHHSDATVVDSIKSVIAGLYSEVKDELSTLNNQLLDTRIAQETTHSELEKLQILLRTMVAPSQETSEDGHANRKPSEEKHANEKPSGTSASCPTANTAGQQANVGPIQHTVKTADSKQPSLQPNRTETIVDPETQNVVFNDYKNGCVVRSTMRDTKGKTLYELDFKDNKILKSRNYDLKGQLTIEEVFYENGQVHYRNEYTPKGKITTEFDKNGNKK